MPAVLSAIPSTPTSSSSGWELVAVLPELSVVPLPVAVRDLSTLETAMPSKEKKLAALFEGTVAPNVTVMVPPDKVLVTRPEKRSVRTPPALLMSASLVYVLPALSVTVTLPAPALALTATNTVLLTARLTAGHGPDTPQTRVETEEPVSSLTVPRLVPVVGTRTVKVTGAPVK